MTQQFPYPGPQGQPPQFDPPPGAGLPYGIWPGMARLKHSGCGIAAFVIAITMGLLELATVVMAGVYNQQGKTEKSPEVMLVGCVLLLGLAGCFVGIVLAVIGLFQTNRTKLFAILGLVLNACILLGMVGLMLFGLSMKH